MLDKQIQIYSVDTGNFYSGRESRLHWLNHRLRSERNELVRESKEIERRLCDMYGIDPCDIRQIYEGECAHRGDGDFVHLCHVDDYVFFASERYVRICELVAMKNRKIKETKESLLGILSNKVEENLRTGGRHHIRVLSENEVSKKNVISVFDSYFTRTIGAEQDELCEDFMVVQVYYFDVIKDLIHFGFVYKGERYVYFTSSAGQIRTKKTVFVKESVWKKCEKSIMCGLTLDDINAKGGNNPNKHLAYLALANSATDVWDEFDIDRSIVVDDFETEVLGTYDLVDDADYSIRRVTEKVPITHTDGAGMMLPCMGRNRMVRLPWVKGLLGSFDFARFIEENGCSPIIRDIYGAEHDVIAEGIQVIFTKSQFKMWKYYDSWEDYKKKYKEHGCTAGMTNIEEDRIKDATINYQMLQTLADASDDEVAEIASSSISKLTGLCSSVDSVKSAFGVTPYNTSKNAFQKAIDLYPDLLNDEYVKSQLRDIKDSMVKKYKSGKLQVRGKYTFILPDFYAACQHWFMGIDDPDGLLEDGEVFCWLFRKSEKLDCLRSPHLFMEHAVRTNAAFFGCDRRDEIRKWYGTDAVYTSCKDLISKVLMFDCDGDKSLVVSDEKVIEVAERNLKRFDIVPLFYNMKKAEPVHLDNSSIYDGLNAAFTGGNIGQYSNNISKIWNSDRFILGTDDDKKDAINIIKLLCMENNFVIDYAKTLYKPERPSDVDDLIKSYTREPLPHFFEYAKDKSGWQVSDVNGSFVNRLDGMIPNPRINCRRLGLGKIDYRMMMSNPDIRCRIELNDRGKIIKSGTDPMISRYCELNSKYHFALDGALRTDRTFSDDAMRKSKYRQSVMFDSVSSEIRSELSGYGYSDEEVADVLVKYLYGIRNSKHKVALWMCYGDIILSNIEKNFKKSTREVQCEDCGEWFEVPRADTATSRCHDCKASHKRELARLRKRRQREKELCHATS